MNGSIVWQTVGWIALVLNVYGNPQLTGKTRYGWLVRLLVNLLWIWYSINQRAWPLLANHAVFVPINIYGWIKWRKKANEIVLRVEKVNQLQLAYDAIKEIQRLRSGLHDIEIEFKNQPLVVHAVRRVRID